MGGRGVLGGGVWGAGASERGGVEERTGGPPCRCGGMGADGASYMNGENLRQDVV